MPGTVSPEDIVSVVGIEPGSTRINFVVAGALIGAASTVLQAIESNEVEALPRLAQQELHGLSTLTDRRSWSATIAAESSSGEAPRSFPVPVIPPPAPPVQTTGPTTLYGTCIGVGGVTPRAQLRTLDGSIVRMEADTDIAKALAHKLYEDVGVDGIAEWRTDTWALESFKAESLAPFEDPDPVVALEELSRLGNGVWDDVDAAKYVDDLRGRPRG